jgi:DNA-binding GntR family transcriptional regulator
MRRGADVTEVNAKDLHDVFHLMAVLEADAAGTVASTATAAQLQALEALHQQLENAARDRKDHLRFFQLNEAFHVKLLEIANNRWAGQMVADLRKVMKLNRAQSLLKAGRIEESLAEHAAIMAALTSRDTVAAQAAMRAHIESGGQEVAVELRRAHLEPVGQFGARAGARKKAICNETTGQGWGDGLACAPQRHMTAFVAKLYQPDVI